MACYGASIHREKNQNVTEIWSKMRVPPIPIDKVVCRIKFTLAYDKKKLDHTLKYVATIQPNISD